VGRIGEDRRWAAPREAHFDSRSARFGGDIGMTELADQWQTEAAARVRKQGAEADAVVGDHDDALVIAEVDIEDDVAAAARIGVSDDVRAGFGDREGNVTGDGAPLISVRVEALDDEMAEVPHRLRGRGHSHVDRHRLAFRLEDSNDDNDDDDDEDQADDPDTGSEREGGDCKSGQHLGGMPECFCAETAQS
jgi:hypothetical protein